MRAWLLFAAGLLCVGGLVAACGDDDDDDVTVSPTATAPATGSPTRAATSPATAAGTPTSGVTPTAASRPQTAAEVIAKDPQYFVYVVRQGDTLEGVAAAFNGTPGAAAAGFADQVRELNKLTGSALTAGTELAIPLRLAGTLAMMPEASMEAVLGVGAAGAPLLLFQPSLTAREGYLGRLLMHRVELADGAPAAEGFGYIVEYWLADRPPLKGGAPDPDARASDPAFIVAGGSLVAAAKTANPGRDTAERRREGVPYAVIALKGAGQTAEQLTAMLQTAKDR